jgi:hypothetical protein
VKFVKIMDNPFDLLKAASGVFHSVAGCSSAGTIREDPTCTGS